MNNFNQRFLARADHQVRVVRASDPLHNGPPPEPGNRYTDLDQRPHPAELRRAQVQRDLQAELRELETQVRDKQGLQQKARRENQRLSEELEEFSVEAAQMKRRLAELFRENSAGEASAREQIKAIAQTSSRVDELRRELTGLSRLR